MPERRSRTEGGISGVPDRESEGTYSESDSWGDRERQQGRKEGRGEYEGAHLRVATVSWEGGVALPGLTMVVAW